MLIGIIGGSGAGKSTVTNMLEAKLCNSSIIRVDDIMRKYIKIYMDEIKKVFNIEQIDLSILFEEYSSIEKWMSVCGDSINCQVKKMVDEYVQTYDYILIDYCLLSMLEIYKECDITINVIANRNIKSSRLRNRLATTEHFKIWEDENKLIKRIDSTCVDGVNFNSKYIINNNGSLKELDDEINLLVGKIFKKKFR